MKVLPLLKIITVSSMIRLMKFPSPKAKCIHFMVHIFFGTIIVTSFVMILMMTLNPRTKSPEDGTSSRCLVNKCRVQCTDVNFVEEQEMDVIIATMEADSNYCTSITLIMIRPIFKNSTLPESWLATVRSNVRELSIVNGNLKHIPPRSFMDPFSDNIQTLIFHGVKMKIWREDTFLGLSNLRELYIKDCTLEQIKINALQAIDSLQLLNIRTVHFWNPINVTGTSHLSKLEKVNLSFNSFYDALNNETFVSLPACKVLYLNSCKITFIGLGTFDPLKSLKILYLNDNLLVTIPLGLFDRLLTSETIRIALHENFWLCSCKQNDLRSLHNNNVLILEPICVYPDAISGLTFSEFEEYCESNSSLSKAHTHQSNEINTCKTKSISTIIYDGENCYQDNSLFDNVSKSAPTIDVCLANRIRENDLNKIYQFMDCFADSESAWIKPVYSTQFKKISMVEMAVTGEYGNGILWYPIYKKHQIFCINTIPDILQVFYADDDGEYIFCPFNITTGYVHNNKCLSYTLTDFKSYPSTIQSSLLFDCLTYTGIAFGCLLFGAMCVFIIINKNPTLLKRNKRILLVKHKTIDALILPPEIQVRKNTLDKEKSDMRSKNNEKIFVLPYNDLLSQNYERSTSMRSSESNDVSYISALSPTEEQLHEWRSNGTRKDWTPTSENDVSPLSSLYESLPYYSLHDKSYETIN